MTILHLFGHIFGDSRVTSKKDEAYGSGGGKGGRGGGGEGGK